MKKLLSALLRTPVAEQHQGQPVPYGDNAAVGKYYEVHGIKMYVEIYGEGTPLLLLHGNNGSIASFSENIPYFSQKYQVIAVDSRAQGKTIDHGDELSFKMMADDFAELLDLMHIEQCHVLGWSDGGICALLMAMRHPRKVISLAATGANLTTGEEAFAPGFYDMVKRHHHLHRLIPRLTRKQRNDWKLFMLDYEQPQISFDELNVIQCPAFIICGDHDVISVEHTAQIARHISNSHLWVIPDSEHATLIQHRDEFNRRVDGFFLLSFEKQNGER
ncbi:pimeloyl-ACP methyl ester carboxylesterase [Mucilaginibacter yixingensis]|uniref:Pimeloyl-ACP methyl ester carboxylesterase n=1 Tax=Mucilaginibacter yixingensis TaxID=1295612 RepID=A0A2T5JGS1_9SPHI|nr:alpha/beta hydrolase [Mucilaginibacter yixingensis]PTR01643.1 pimeloyl-ACP methyl ester carboxylesterase [Mucilaginibacter yixingensis]